MAKKWVIKEIDSEEYIEVLEILEDKVLVKYHGEKMEVETQYRVPAKGTYNQNVRTVPYFVLDNNVYHSNDFEEQEFKSDVAVVLEKILQIFKIMFISKLETDSKFLKTFILSVRIAIIPALFLSIFGADNFLSVMIFIVITVFLVCYFPEILKKLFGKKEK